jgi:hypothetical protein
MLYYRHYMRTIRIQPFSKIFVYINLIVKKTLVSVGPEYNQLSEDRNRSDRSPRLILIISSCSTEYTSK